MIQQNFIIMYIHAARPESVPFIIQDRCIYSLTELMKLKLDREDYENYFDEFIGKFGDEINPSKLAKSDISYIGKFVWLYPAEDDELWGHTIVNSRLKRSDEVNPVKFLFNNHVKQKYETISSVLFMGIRSRLELDENLLAIIMPGEDTYKQIVGQINDHYSRKFLHNLRKMKRFIG